MSPFRIGHLTDIHLTLKEETTIDGIDVISNFEKILSEITAWSPDLLALTGDLCFTRNDKNIYQFVKKKLDATGLEYVVISGNHDKSSDLAKIFGYEMTGRDLYHVRDIQGYRLIFADSSRHRVTGKLLERIRDDLQTALRPILFIHHPPAKAGVPFMDLKYPLINMDELQEVLYTYPKRIPVFCGHYHNGKDFSEGNLDIHMTPSTYFQISDVHEKFMVASKIAGWRSIELSDKVESELHYLNL